jgi:hypothetical protein
LTKKDKKKKKKKLKEEFDRVQHFALNPEQADPTLSHHPASAIQLELLKISSSSLVMMVLSARTKTMSNEERSIWSLLEL